MNKLTKHEAGYIKPPPKSTWPSEGKGIRCGTCRYFGKGSTLGKGTCAVVEGAIHAQGCCNLWTQSGKSTSVDYACGQDIEDILSNNKYFT